MASMEEMNRSFTPEEQRLLTAETDRMHRWLVRWFEDIGLTPPDPAHHTIFVLAASAGVLAQALGYKMDPVVRSMVNQGLQGKVGKELKEKVFTILHKDCVRAEGTPSPGQTSTDVKSAVQGLLDDARTPDVELGLEPDEKTP